MTTPELISELLKQLGAFSIFALVLALVVKHPVQTWLTRRITSSIEENATLRLARSQLDLDKELEGFRSALNAEFERLRSRLGREAADYEIWAQKRHEATAKLFAEYLRAELSVTETPELPLPDHTDTNELELVSFVERSHLSKEANETLLQLFRADRQEELARRLEAEAESARRSRIISARNQAYEAYYAAALYLSDPVDQAAREIRDHFHTIVIPFVAPDANPGMERLKNRNQLRLLMLELQNRARADLSRSSAT